MEILDVDYRERDREKCTFFLTRACRAILFSLLVLSLASMIGCELAFLKATDFGTQGKRSRELEKELREKEIEDEEGKREEEAMV